MKGDERLPGPEAKRSAVLGGVALAKSRGIVLAADEPTRRRGGRDRDDLVR